MKSRVFKHSGFWWVSYDDVAERCLSWEYAIWVALKRYRISILEAEGFFS